MRLLKWLTQLINQSPYKSVLFIIFFFVSIVFWYFGSDTTFSSYSVQYHYLHFQKLMKGITPDIKSNRCKLASKASDLYMMNESSARQDQLHILLFKTKNWNTKCFILEMLGTIKVTSSTFKAKRSSCSSLKYFSGWRIPVYFFHYEVIDHFNLNLRLITQKNIHWWCQAG